MTLKNTLESASSFTNGSRKLEKLSLQQFEELSKDVYDELDRRLNRPDIVPFLPLKNSFHPKRNQARQKLATLYSSKFTDLIIDIYQELRKRFPQISENINKAYNTQKPSANAESLSPNNQIPNPSLTSDNDSHQQRNPSENQPNKNFEKRPNNNNEPSNLAFNFNNSNIPAPTIITNNNNNTNNNHNPISNANNNTFNKNNVNQSSDPRYYKASDFINMQNEPRNFKPNEFSNNQIVPRSFKPPTFNNNNITSNFKPNNYNTPQNESRSYTGQNDPRGYKTPTSDARSFKANEYDKQNSESRSYKNFEHPGDKANQQNVREPFNVNKGINIDRIRFKDFSEYKNKTQNQEKSALSEQLGNTITNGNQNSNIIEKYKAEINKLKQQISKISSSLKIQIEKNSVFLESEKNNVSIRNKNALLTKENNKLISKIKSMNIEMDQLNMEHIKFKNELDMYKTKNADLENAVKGLENKLEKQSQKSKASFDNLSNSDTAKNLSRELSSTTNYDAERLTNTTIKDDISSIKNHNKAKLKNLVINYSDNFSAHSAGSLSNESGIVHLNNNLQTHNLLELRDQNIKLFENFNSNSPGQNGYTGSKLIDIYSKSIANSKLLYQKSIYALMESLNTLRNDSSNNISIVNKKNIEFTVSMEKVYFCVKSLAQDTLDFEGFYKAEIQKTLTSPYDSVKEWVRGSKDLIDSCSEILKILPDYIQQLETELSNLNNSAEFFKKAQKFPPNNLVETSISKLTSTVIGITDLACDESFSLFFLSTRNLDNFSSMKTSVSSGGGGFDKGDLNDSASSGLRKNKHFIGNMSDNRIGSDMSSSYSNLGSSNQTAQSVKNQFIPLMKSSKSDPPMSPVKATRYNERGINIDMSLVKSIQGEIEYDEISAIVKQRRKEEDDEAGANGRVPMMHHQLRHELHIDQEEEETRYQRKISTGPIGIQDKNFLNLPRSDSKQKFVELTQNILVSAGSSGNLAGNSRMRGTDESLGESSDLLAHNIRIGIKDGKEHQQASQGQPPPVPIKSSFAQDLQPQWQGQVESESERERPLASRSNDQLAALSGSRDFNVGSGNGSQVPDPALKIKARYDLLVSSNSIVNTIEYVFHIVKNNSLSGGLGDSPMRPKFYMGVVGPGPSDEASASSNTDYGSISIVLYDNLMTVCALVELLLQLCASKIFSEEGEDGGSGMFNLTADNTELGRTAVKGLQQGHLLLLDSINDINDIVDMVDEPESVSSDELADRFGNSLKNVDLQDSRDAMMITKLMDPIVTDLIQDPIFKQNIIMNTYDVAKFTKTLISIFE
ncbi:hypothetical protein AYI69_g1584 [Smittium culicis]|uniref:GIT Spa2 homology (SHD) domain-containing protein n=1 Tax=Smittium culicis TaxID=133412 RepID=A0A1R1YQ04_9FUNG|nr:hypothetical protein AYI69_g1584 [Smittium culicis]